MYAKVFKFSLVALTMISLTAHAGRLQIGDAQVDGDLVTVPVVLSDEGSGPVSTMDFQLRYDPNVFEPVHAANGASASAADKNVSGNANEDGGYKVIVVGLNQNAIPAGEVASVVLRRMPNATDSQSNVRIVNTTFADVNANEIPSRGDSRSISLDANTNADDDGQVEDDMESDEEEEAAPNNETRDAEQTERSTEQRQKQPAGSSSGDNDNVVVADSGQNDAGATTNRSATGGGGALSGTSSDDEGGAERMEDAVAAADNTRRTIATPSSGDDSDEENGNTDSGNEAQASVSDSESAGYQDPIGGDDSTSGRTQVAKADTDATQSASMTDAADSGAGDDTSSQGADATSQSQDNSSAAADGAGGNTATIAIVIALVAAGVLGLFFLRNRLFA